MARTKANEFHNITIRLEEARKAMKETIDRRLYERYQCIFLFLSGESRKRITEILNRNIGTVSTYIRAYCTEGLKGLQPDQPPGRPTRLTSEQEQELYQTIINKRPVDVGFPAHMNWESGLVRQWIGKQYQVEYFDRGTRKLLYRLGFKRDFEGIKKLHYREIARILFEDECMIRDYQALAKTWFPKGQQKLIPTYGQHRGAKLMGTLDYETGEIYCEEHEQYDAQVFHSFLENIVARMAKIYETSWRLHGYPTGS
ncbi:transposase [Paenibacillus alginolyticus]|uniref:Transposase n=1 Tax=Paenibacillus alginolyticus TaxID=59839 RepID=A0ABT4GQ41_9BACL|nr:transposase [Paenibacillus alginolyticus]MCY9698118.1 transposase [Paenibacillus alginolyticus]MEC0148491.1 transposase [Paenibacillus alginolyticus]